jgi:hypothetical protein
MRGSARGYDLSMRQRIRWRWWGKWAATIAIMPVVFLWVASCFRPFDANIVLGRYDLELAAANGRSRVCAFRDQPAKLRKWWLDDGRWQLGLRLPRHPLWAWPWFKFWSGPLTTSLWWIEFPLWVPGAFFASVSGALWHWDRLRARRRADICEQCGYDLSGVAAGVCPECGAGLVTTA